MTMALSFETIGVWFLKKTRRGGGAKQGETALKSWILQRQAQGDFPNLCPELKLNKTFDL